MSQPLTIQAELRLPPEALAPGIEALERQLQFAGLLPVEAQARRWRMDAEHPGGYVLTFSCALVPVGEEAQP